MELLDLADLVKGIDLSQRRFLEFQRSKDLSSGIYVIPAGGEDHQSPHAEDEVYYVLQGDARVEVAGETQDARPGTFLFVPAHAPHRFVDVRETLVLLVVFGPAYRSRGA